LYAKDYDGYKSLIKLSSIQNERKVTKEELSKYNKNVIAILPYDSKETYKELTSVYEDLYIGYRNKKEQTEVLLQTTNIVFFRESLYLTKNDESTLPYLYRIRDGKTISDDIIYDTENHELNIKNILDLTDNTGLLATHKIAESCNLEFPPAKLLLPIYDCEDPSKYLFELCKAGLTKRLNGNIPDKYKQRLSYELNIINEMGFPNYFLVVYDFIKFAKKNKILVGPGRGSAAGSLVAYSLGITDIDPLEYDLLFERFLNPARKTMPDIDTDFPDDKRGEVINYVIEKYGKKRVCGIVTFGTMSAKQVLRDVARVLNIPGYKVDGLCKFIPGVTKEKLKDFYNKNQAFKARIDSDTSLTTLFEIACKLEGYPRHTSSHAAGIVMSQVDLDEVIPLTTADGMYLTSYTMEYLEDLGLLKMDFLGLKNLSTINNIINDIKEQTGEVIDFNKIPLDDKETFKVFETANTCGIFQFESTGMRNFLRRLRPTTFDDICDAIAIFRPGAASNIDNYIKRRHGEEKIEYIDKELESISKNTYGLLIYQEQIMQLASIYADYTLGEADILRRAMSKKKLELLQAEEEKFIEKSVKKGHSVDDAKKVYELVLNFAGFGFNKSHSVAYAIIAYKLAYLKTHYKTIFFANLLTNVIGSEAKTHEYIMEAKSNKIEVVKPTINKSEDRYLVEDDKIIYPISNIKSIGSVISETIKKAKSEGPFTDIYDCFSRLYIAGVGKKNFETLIMADVFKEFNYNRATLFYNLDSLFNYAELTKDIDPSLVMKPDIEIEKEYENTFLLEKEKEVFGFYLSSHPTTMYKKDNPYCIPLISVEKSFGKQVDTLILVDKIKTINTKKGDKMAFITGSDETSTLEYTLFPKIYNQYSNIQRGDLLKIRGNVERRLDQIQIIVDKIKKLNEEENINEE
ncbi:MAG: DNA polymerase III subunit alpha, partial [Bacilli bacterium]|nr:DNA polymerase III subunit alpha [Bacilli bacterium]